MSKWISVKKYLPPFLAIVLIYIPEVSHAFIVGYLGEDGNFYSSNESDDSDCLLMRNEITHWMPLSDPPEYT